MCPQLNPDSLRLDGLSLGFALIHHGVSTESSCCWAKVRPSEIRLPGCPPNKKASRVPPQPGCTRNGQISHRPRLVHNFVHNAGHYSVLAVGLGNYELKGDARPLCDSVRLRRHQHCLHRLPGVDCRHPDSVQMQYVATAAGHKPSSPAMPPHVHGTIASSSRIQTLQQGGKRKLGDRASL